MGINLFSKNCDFSISAFQEENAAPEPDIFKIIKLEQIENHVVALINYPNCTNYEGNKICVFAYMSEKRLKKLKEIDPHFSEDMNSPFARFKPTQYGWEMALKIAEFID